MAASMAALEDEGSEGGRCVRAGSIGEAIVYDQHRQDVVGVEGGDDLQISLQCKIRGKWTRKNKKRTDRYADQRAGQQKKEGEPL